MYGRPYAAALASALGVRGAPPDDARDRDRRARSEKHGAAGPGQLCRAWMRGVEYNNYSTDTLAAADGPGLEQQREEWETSLVYDRRPLPAGSEYGGWLTYCEPPDALVLNYGLWNTASHGAAMRTLEVLIARFQLVCGRFLDLVSARIESKACLTGNTIRNIQNARLSVSWVGRSSVR